MEKKHLKKSAKKVLSAVLIVEDDRSLLKALSDVFRREKFEVLTATNGKVGLRSALKNKPGLILLDLLMPVMDGVAMLKELRKDEWGKNVYVIILTNKEPDSSLSNEAGMAPYMSTYMMKSDHNIKDIVKFAKSKILHQQ